MEQRRGTENAPRPGAGGFSSMAPLVRRLRERPQLEESLALFTLALARHPDRACLLNLRGLALLGLGRLDEAEAAFGLLAAEHPAAPEGFEGLAEALHRRQRWEDCLAACRQALERGSRRAETLDMQGEALMSLGRFEEAAEAYAGLKRAHPGLPQGYDGLARALYRLGRHDLCRAACALALQKFPGRPNMQNLQGLALLALSRFEEAGALYAGLQREHPGLPWGYDGLADAFVRQRRWQEALDALQAALEKFPGRAGVLGLKGRALLGLGRLDEAAGLYAEFLGRHPELPLGYEGLIEARSGQKRWEDCLELCAQVLQHFPERVQNLNHLGFALQRLGRFAELKRRLEEHFARCGLRRLPRATRRFFEAQPLVTPQLVELYAKACLVQGETELAVGLLDDMHHYAQAGAAKDALYGEYAVLAPHFDNSVMGVVL